MDSFQSAKCRTFHIGNFVYFVFYNPKEEKERTKLKRIQFIPRLMLYRIVRIFFRFGSHIVKKREISHIKKPHTLSEYNAEKKIGTSRNHNDKI